MKYSKKRWLGKFKKRHLLLLASGALLLLIHSGLFAFRNTDEQIETYLMKKGQSPDFVYYTYQDRQMHYVEVGEEKEGPLLLFLHGSPGAADAAIDYLSDSRLSRRATLVAVDRPGYGYSGFGETEPSLQAQADAIYPILRRIKHRRVILVGHSYGGPLAARIAMDHPEEIDGMILIAPSIDPQLEPPTWWRSILNIWGIRWLAPKALRVCNQEIIALKQELEKMLPLWKKITTRTIIIQGEEDKLVPPENAAFGKRMLVNSDSVEVKMIEGGNHFILWSETELISQAILSLLDEG